MRGCRCRGCRCRCREGVQVQEGVQGPGVQARGYVWGRVQGGGCRGNGMRGCRCRGCRCRCREGVQVQEGEGVQVLLQLLHCVLHHTSRVLLLLSVADFALLSSFSTSSTP